MKFYRTAITFLEYPDQISLVFEISGCPNHCVGCSEPELAEDIGEELTFSKVDLAIQQNPGVTLIGFAGGDQDHDYLLNLVIKLKEAYPDLKFGMYSGRNYLDLKLLNVLDYYKIGEWRMFQGDESTWKDQCAGPMVLPVSNQVMFKRVGDKWVNITDCFRENKVNNWRSVIIC